MTGASMATPIAGAIAGGLLVLRGSRTLGLCVLSGALGLALVRDQLARLVTRALEDGA